MEPCSFTTVPDSPYIYFPDNLRVHKEGTLMYTFECSQNLTHQTWTEFSFSVPLLLKVGISLSLITYKCLLQVRDIQQMLKSNFLL
jgi:hypothetical protein